MSINLIHDYAEGGFRVFPLHNHDCMTCGCGDPDCDAIGKHPSFSGWDQSPHWSEEQLEAMVEHSITTGFGVCLDQHLVLDIDARNGGLESYDKLVKDTGLDFHKESGFVVKTGGGGWHYYFTVPKGVALVYHLPQYPGIDFKSGMGKGSFMVGCGSLHKSGMEYERDKGFPDEITEAPAKLIDLLRKADHHRATVEGSHVDVTDQDITDMLGPIDPDCTYDDWIAIGMAIHHGTNGHGFELWRQWSDTGSKYPGTNVLERHWHSFGKSANPVTLGTLLHIAETYGYERSITFPEVIEEAEVDGHPFPVDNVDLLRPPGFVGEVCTWINAQCRFPREKLAVIASLVAMGNIVGLRHIDDKDGVTANLFAFCVAGSSSGKESIMQASTEILSVAGVSGALAGAIKSEQEVARALTRNQAAFFVIDEMGIFLGKIANAKKSGSAPYLDGVIGILMSAYSKASSYMLLTGDMKEDVKKDLRAELKQCKTMTSENEDPSGAMARRIPQIESALRGINRGLERPFVSLMGFSTPETFNYLMTPEQAKNGFIGRSILVSEKETNPRRKKGFKKTPMSSQMRATLQNLYLPGSYDMTEMRVEYYGEQVKIRTEAKAAEMLEMVADWIEDYAEEQKGTTGLEAVVRRGYELCAKVSLILAVPSGLRTVEHVRWAYAMMRRDIDEKVSLAHSNELDNRKDQGSQSEALLQRIISLVDEKDGETLSVIANRNRKFSRETVEEAVERLVTGGQLERRTSTHPRNGKEIVKFYAKG